MYKITLGYQGATDCRLKLHHPDGRVREYFIESTPWKILSLMRSKDIDELGPDLGPHIWNSLWWAEGIDFQYV